MLKYKYRYKKVSTNLLNEYMQRGWDVCSKLHDDMVIIYKPMYNRDTIVEIVAWTIIAMFALAVTLLVIFK